jgi:hypothetical protein
MANERLSEMNKNLLLMTRIDTGQYPDLQAIQFSDMISRIVGYYRENGEESAMDRDRPAWGLPWSARYVNSTITTFSIGINGAFIA